MLITLEEMKNYLRVDFDDDDALIETLITAATRICMDILRTENLDELSACENAKAAIFIPLHTCTSTERRQIITH